MYDGLWLRLRLPVLFGGAKDDAVRLSTGRVGFAPPQICLVSRERTSTMLVVRARTLYHRILVKH